jgi:hypothetical protein
MIRDSRFQDFETRRTGKRVGQAAAAHTVVGYPHHSHSEA